jgi:hypothetical protein
MADSEAGSATSRKQVPPCRGKSSLFERGDEAKPAAGVQISRAVIVHQLPTPHIIRCRQAAARSRAAQKTGRLKIGNVPRPSVPDIGGPGAIGQAQPQ